MQIGEKKILSHESNINSFDNHREEKYGMKIIKPIVCLVEKILL